MSEWFENEDFWTEMYPYMFPEERFESAPEEIDKISFAGGVQRDTYPRSVLRPRPTCHDPGRARIFRNGC